MSGLSIRHVPYKGAGPAMVDVIAGRVDMMFTNIAAVQGGIEAGKLRLLATGGSSRWPSFPDVPTIAEAGVPGYEASAWYGLMLPTGTPAAVLERLQRALTKVRSPESMVVIRRLGAEPIVSLRHVAILPNPSTGRAAARFPNRRLPSADEGCRRSA